MLALFLRSHAFVVAITVTCVITANANQPPIFTNCIPSLSGSHCGPFSNGFQATDPDGDTGIVYVLISGIGSIDARLGIYTANGVPVGSNTVTVGVTDVGGSGNTTLCQFEVTATNEAPRIVWYYPFPEQVLVGSTENTVVDAFDDCDQLLFMLLDSGGIDGDVEINEWTGVVSFTPSATDVQLPQPIVMEVGVTDGIDTARCEIKWKVLTQPPFGVLIPNVHSYACGETVTVPIWLKTDSITSKVYAFDVLIAYDKSYLTLKDVIPGNLISDCHWQYFYWQEETPPVCDGCPSGLVRITGLAGSSGQPANVCLSDTAHISTIAQPRFTLNGYGGQFFPIRFYWKDCRDNIFLASTDSISEPTILYSSRVFDFGSNITDDRPLPSYFGAPKSCVAEGGNAPTYLRQVDFRNGGIDDICEPPWDASGDINLNLLSYELADYNMFRQYFTQGTAAFMSHPFGSTAASDVNHDNLTLTLPDLIALYRIVKGIDDSPAAPGVSIRPTTVHYDGSSGAISISSDDSLAAVRLLFKGTSPVSVTGQAAILSWGSYDTVTSVLLAPTDSSGLIPILDGTQLTINPPLPLLSVEVTTMDARYVQTFIEGYSDVGDIDEVLPLAFELFQNYPNPFNLTTTISFSLPMPSDVRLEIVNILGEIVFEFCARMDAGPQSLEWNGQNRNGRIVSSGVYYARLTAGEFSAVRKMMLLK